jgi:hypothetical protein
MWGRGIEQVAGAMLGLRQALAMLEKLPQCLLE